MSKVTNATQEPNDDDRKESLEELSVKLPDSPDDNSLDISELAMDQSFATGIGAKKQLTSVPVQRPHKQWFVRVHPDPHYRMAAVIIEFKELQEVYIVHKSMQPFLPAGETNFKMLYAAVNRFGTPFIWPVSLKSADGRRNLWTESAQQAVDLAVDSWIKMVPNMEAGAYDVYKATGNLAAPEFPEIDFAEWLRLAFKDRIISDANHEVLRKLRGEM